MIFLYRSSYSRQLVSLLELFSMHGTSYRAQLPNHITISYHENFFLLFFHRFRRIGYDGSHFIQVSSSTQHPTTRNSISNQFTSPRHHHYSTIITTYKFWIASPLDNNAPNARRGPKKNMSAAGFDDSTVKGFNLSPSFFFDVWSCPWFCIAAICCVFTFRTFWYRGAKPLIPWRTLLVVEDSLRCGLIHRIIFLIPVTGLYWNLVARIFFSLYFICGKIFVLWMDGAIKSTHERCGRGTYPVPIDWHDIVDGTNKPS